MSVYKNKLPNGVTVVVDSDTRFSSVSIAVALQGGLRSENLETVGLTHLCEHLLFKRTNTKTPLQIAQYIDSFGGELNAFTDTDCLCVHGVVPKNDAQRLMDFIAEIFLQSAFNEKDLELEREVIKQEILDSQDDPVDLTYRKFCSCFWPNSTLAFSAFGDLNTLNSFSYGDVYERLHSLLQGDKIIISASGAIDPKQVEDFATQYFSHLEKGKKADLIKPKSASGLYLFPERFSQAYFTFGSPAPGLIDVNFDSSAVIATILGGGFSSKLFQALRENHGLVYDINAGLEINADTSALLISGACDLDNLPLALELLVREINNLRADKISSEDFSRTISSHISQLLMEEDSITGRMWRALESEIMHGKQVANKEIIDRLKSLTLDQVNNFIDIMLKDFLLVVVGEIEGFEPSQTVKELCGEIPK